MKKLFALILVIVLALGSLPLTAMAEETGEYMLGDVNFDSKVNIKDATSIRKYIALIFDFNALQILSADTDGDEKINIKDATWIQKFIAEIDCPYEIGGIFGEDNVPETTVSDTSSVSSQPATDVTTIETVISSEAVETTDRSEVMDTTVSYSTISEPVSESVTNSASTATESVSDISTIGTTVVELTSENTTVTVATTDYDDLTESTAQATIATDPIETTEATEVTTASNIVTESAVASEVNTTVTVITDVTVTTVVTDPVETTASKPNSGIELPDHDFEDDETVSTVTEEETVIPYIPVKPDTNITIYFSNNQKWSTVNAYLYNEALGKELKAWPGTAMELHETNNFGETIYKLDVDVSVYNRVVFNNGKSQTLNAALTVASSGFFITRNNPKTAMQLGVYAYGTDDYGSKTSVNLKYPDGYNKPIEIWTPAGYDPADTSKKYSVIYLLDGQNQFDDSDAYEGGWGSDEIVTALMKNGGEGYILVGINNQTNRDSELTPDIGDVVSPYNKQGFENGTGERFSNFVADTVVPYIESNYNVYTDAAHSAIVGSSSGGIEAFYIGMEHMDEFGRIGALSPAFMLFNESTWLKYFEKYDFANIENLPRIYFYNGGGDALENELLPAAEGMQDLLSGLGYDSTKMIFAFDEKNQHNEAAWRNVMPEVISWLFELQ